jgi:hypothetical protein
MILPATSGHTVDREYGPADVRHRCRNAEGGWALATTMIAICVASVALVNHAILVCYSAVAARQSRFAFQCRQAATDCLTHQEPDTEGGDVAPATPLVGWSDVVFVDPSTGALAVAGSSSVPPGATLLQRQWRVGLDGGGRRVFEVSVVACERTRTPRRGPFAARIILSKRLA